MLEILKKLMGGGTPSPPSDPEAGPSEEELRTAACVLFLELAWADDEFSDAERNHLLGVLQRHFGLTDDESMELLAAAGEERSRAVDLWRYTNVIRDHFSMGQKMVLAEAMWGLVYSDGVLSEHEGPLLRKLSHLLGIRPGYLSEARKRWESADPTPDID